MEKANGKRRSSGDHAELLQQLQRLQQAPESVAATASPATGTKESFSSKRKLYAIAEREESSPVTVAEAEPVAVPDAAYDADVDDIVELPQRLEQPVGCPRLLSKLAGERELIYELFQPWALKTYGDQAKTKTITLRKKARILKALEGKEHSRPDSSKFRFWVKTKGFTTKRPEGFEEAAGGQRRMKPLPSNAVLSDSPGAVDLFAASTSKDFGRRIYRKVACVEEFFDIIYNVHMELGGRSGMHAGQKRTYRIITETYAFLPREAVTRFLTICPECKKNLRPSSPASASLKDQDLAGNESSSEVETFNYSSQTESSLEAGPTAKRRRHSSAEIKALTPLPTSSASSCSVQPEALMAPIARADSPISSSTVAMPQPGPSVETTTAVSVPKIRVKPQLQRPLTPPIELPTTTGATALPPFPNPCFDMKMLKSRDNLLRYYDFMRRFYAGGSLNLMLNQPVLAPPLYGSSLLQSLSFPTTTTTNTNTTSTAQKSSNHPKQASPKAESESATPTSSASKQFKTSPDSSLCAHSPLSSTAMPSAHLQTPINLTKSLFCSTSNVATPPPSAAATAPTTSTPVAAAASALLKLELPSPPKRLAELRIPQPRGSASAEMPLQPLDLERLKPITSTYLQLTRSMGLSDEDALRFDNLLSC